MQVQTLGRFQILKELGRGAMGRVFLAHDPEIDRRVAIKTIQIFASLPEAERHDARQRFLREARSAGKLLHPGIVTLFDVGEAEGIPYLAMEYVEGKTLDLFCRPETLLPVETVVLLGTKAAEALAFAHASGIVHRDIKPANLMRVGENDVKIMDFGLAKTSETQLTHDGSLHGTPNYMSPEQIRGEELDGRSDLFSLAVVLYEMLAGEKPFTGDSISSVLYRIVHEKADLKARAERVSPAIATFLDRALAKQPADRFATGAEFAAAFRRAHQGRALATSPTPVRRDSAPTPGATSRSVVPPPPPARPLASAKWPYVLVAAVIGTLLLGGAAYFQARSGSKSPAVAPAEWLDARVRTDPPGLPVLLDGKPLAGSHARFRSTAPYGTLSVTERCRTASHQLDPSDGGAEVVLVPDPVRVALVADVGTPGARIRLNDRDLGSSPASLDLDLCEENRIEMRADGYRPAQLVIAAGATPLDARTAIDGLRLDPIPIGTLLLPASRGGVLFFVDGKQVRPSGEGVELPEGSHEVRALSEESWIDVHTKVEVRGGEKVRPEISIPSLGTLVIQAFPPNCRAYLKRSGEEWRYLDDTPVHRRIAAGTYSVKVEFTPTGESREQEVRVSPGPNAPLRFAFPRPRR